MKKITNEQLDSLIRSAMNSSGPLPADEKFAQIISALRELRELRESNDQRGDGEWIEWGGGLDPADQYVEVKFRTGETDRDYVRRFMWKHEGDKYDIIAYRLIPERGNNE